MDIKDKLRLGITMFSSSYIDTNYNKKEMFEKMDNQLKQIDDKYTMSFPGIYNHTVVMFAALKVMGFTKKSKIGLQCI